jgi:hypothetical protein
MRVPKLHKAGKVERRWDLSFRDFWLREPINRTIHRFGLTCAGGLGRNHRSFSGKRAIYGISNADAQPRLWD